MHTHLWKLYEQKLYLHDLVDRIRALYTRIDHSKYLLSQQAIKNAEQCCDFVKKRTNVLQGMTCVSGAFFKPPYLDIAQSIALSHSQTTVFLKPQVNG